MAIDITCPNCRRLIYTPEKSAGKNLPCPGCGKTVLVPDSTGERELPEKLIPVTCPSCSASIHLVPKLLGRRVFCSKCRTALRVGLTLRTIEDPKPFSPQRISSDSAHAPQPTEDLVPGPPEIAEGMLPADSSLVDLQDIVACTGSRQNGELAIPEQENDDSHAFDDSQSDSSEPAIAAPKSGKSEVGSSRSRSTPHPVIAYLRDREVSAAQRRKQSSARETEGHELVSENPFGASRTVPPSGHTVPWFWPLVGATAATCVMLAMLYLILCLMHRIDGQRSWSSSSLEMRPTERREVDIQERFTCQIYTPGDSVSLVTLEP